MTNHVLRRSFIGGSDARIIMGASSSTSNNSRSVRLGAHLPAKDDGVHSKSELRQRAKKRLPAVQFAAFALDRDGRRKQVDRPVQWLSHHHRRPRHLRGRAQRIASQSECKLMFRNLPFCESTT
jgi:hypothetical protein